MPGVYGGDFPTWEKNHMEKRPCEERLELLKKWVETLITAEKVRRTGDRWVGSWCGVSPYHHFTDDDIALLKQIASNAGRFTDVDNMVSKMVEEHECAVKEFELIKKLKELKESLVGQQEATISCQVEIEAQIKNQQETLAKLNKTIDLQRELKKQYALEIQQKTTLLEAEGKEVENLMKELKFPPPEEYCDMIFTLDIINEPMVAADGFTYEKKSIQKWFLNHCTSPTTGAVLPNKSLIPNYSLRSQINQWKEKISVGSTVGATIDKAVTASVAVGSAVGSVDNARSVDNANIVRRSSAGRREYCVIC